MSKRKSKRPLEKHEKLHTRTLLMSFTLVILFSLLSGRLIYLQAVKHEEFKTLVEKQHIQKITLTSQRGAILDRNGELLACNQTVYSMFADRNHILKDLGIACRGLAYAEGLPTRNLVRTYSSAEIRQRYLERVADVLSPKLGQPKWEIVRNLQKSKKVEVLLEPDLEQDWTREMKEHLNQERIRGVYFREKMRRFYPNPHRLTQVLGVVNSKNKGLEGIEKVSNSDLTGTDGYRYIERDRKGREIAAYRGDVKNAKDGNSVRLTIDMRLQNIVENVLDEVGDEEGKLYVPNIGAEKVTVVLMDPMTGEVLAMANRPHYDLKQREGTLRNAAISDFYEPGSTFKILTLASCFDLDLVQPNTRVYCDNGSFKEGKVWLKDDHPYGNLTVEGVLVKSSNIGTYKLARQLGNQRFHHYIKSFGFGEKTNVGLSAESNGLVWPTHQWSGISLSRIGMGYEVSVTPLQMLNAYCTIANGGYLMQPYIIDSCIAPDGTILNQNKPEFLRRVISESAAAKVTRALAKVTMLDAPGIGRGTGTRAALENYRVAGKTGTAQKYSNGGYLSGRYIVSFAGFLPADNPRLAGIVVVDDPQVPRGQRFGGLVAAPIFKRIAERAMAYMNVQPSNLALGKDAAPSQVIAAGAR